MKKKRIKLQELKTHELELMLAGAVGKRKQEIIKVLAKKSVKR